MIVSEKKLVFVHVPKTAGTSIVHTILSHLTGRQIRGSMASQDMTLQKKYGITKALKHGTALELKRHLGKSWDGYYKFAFVRNPWDRAVSGYHWMVDRYKDYKGVPFDQYMGMMPEIHQDPSHRLFQMLRPQVDYLYDGNQLLINDVYRYENVKNAVKFIGKRFDIPISLGRANASRRKPYRSYFNPEFRSVISRLYSKDIQLFDYRF